MVNVERLSVAEARAYEFMRSVISLARKREETGIYNSGQALSYIRSGLDFSLDIVEEYKAALADPKRPRTLLPTDVEPNSLTLDDLLVLSYFDKQVQTHPALLQKR